MYAFFIPVGPFKNHCLCPRIRAPTPYFGIKIVWGNHRLSKVVLWDHFKPYLSLFWIISMDLGSIYIPARHFYEYHFWPINKNWGPLHPNFEKKLSEDIMNRQEYFLGIILSRIWAFLDLYFGFCKVFYTCRACRFLGYHFWR